MTYAAKMPAAMISFLDGEVLYADIDDLSFDVPVLEARVRNVDSNSDHALFPLSAIRQLLIGEITSAPEPPVLDTWERAAFRFLDGQVMRAYIAPRPTLGRHGGIWECVEPEANELCRLGIPYAALKAVFEVHDWDGRTLAERSNTTGAAPNGDRLARILNDRSGPGAKPALDDKALLARLRQSDRKR